MDHIAALVNPTNVTFLPTAASAPPPNPVGRKGRYPHNVSLLWRARARRQMKARNEQHERRVVSERELIASIQNCERLLNGVGDLLTQDERDTLTGKIHRLTCELGRMGRAVH